MKKNNLNTSLTKDDDYVCEVCGSKNVCEKIWIDPNTGENKGYAVFNDVDQWCDDCNDHRTIVMYSTFKQRDEEE